MFLKQSLASTKQILIGCGKQVHAWEGFIASRKLCADVATSYLLVIERNSKDAIISKLIKHLIIKEVDFLEEKRSWLAMEHATPFGQQSHCPLSEQSQASLLQCLANWSKGLPS
jgi:hypothetical protein